MRTSLNVRTDPNLLRRLVQNLVSNAIKYTISGKVLVGARRRGRDVVIEVMDSGIGIPSSKFKTVFKEFARLDEGARTAAGLGLGLSIVDRISRVLSHPVELASTPGRGTIFRVRVPRDLARPRSLGVNAGAQPLPQPLSGLKVLCIDNEPKILEGMALLLSGWGCTVTSAGSLDAIDHLLDNPGANPDVVIADYHLDDGTGIEAILKLRTRIGGAVPGLLLTADRSQDVRAEAEKYGLALQHKPVKPAALRAYVTQAAAIRRAAAE
jgi:CheY-like chemotaxis protein/anti-sigma regulatory factor (Ser/Thr protein kinase)